MKRVLFLLGHLNDLDIEWMLANGSKIRLSKGATLVTKGTAIDHIYIVLSGQFSIVDQHKDIAVIGSGEVIGEMSFLESRLPSVSVTALNSCEVYRIPRALMNKKLEEDVEFRASFYYSLALFLSDRLRKTTNQLGYGTDLEQDALDENVLDGVAQAGSRFHQILQKFSEV